MRVLAFLTLFLFANPCFATFITVARLDRNLAGTAAGSYGGANGGGEFRVTFGTLDSTKTALSDISWNATAYQYRVFCLELSEHIELANNPNNLTTNNVFKVAISDRTVAGNVITLDAGQSGPGDPLSNKTKNIYNNWLSARSNDAGANNVQQAIWKLEENRLPTGAVSVVSAVNTLVSDAAITDVLDVAVMNVFGWNTANAKMLAFNAGDVSTWVGMSLKQDQIIKLGGGFGTGATVPEPATAGLLGLGMLLAGAYRARRNNKVNS